VGIEIERKFLVKGAEWKKGLTGTEFRQGYLTSDQQLTVRVRRAGGQGTLTVKGASSGASRLEFEYVIPGGDAVELLEQLCSKPLIEKIRYKVMHAGMVWDVDEFLGENAGLVLAEIELEHEDQVFEMPSWVGQEVTGDSRFYNACLAEHPVSAWPAGSFPGLTGN